MANELAHNMKDAVLQSVVALSNGAGDTNTTAFDLGSGVAKLAPCELELSIPALTSTHMPTGTTLSVAVQDSADNSSFATLFTYPLRTSSSGLAAAVTRTGIPSNARRYVRYTVTLADAAGTVGDCREVAVAASLVF
jgi:hypothetical protein